MRERGLNRRRGTEREWREREGREPRKRREESAN